MRIFSVRWTKWPVCSVGICSSSYNKSCVSLKRLHLVVPCFLLFLVPVMQPGRNSDFCHKKQKMGHFHTKKHPPLAFRTLKSATKIRKNCDGQLGTTSSPLSPNGIQMLPSFILGGIDTWLLTGFYCVFHAASIFGGLLLRPPPKNPKPDVTEKRKAQQFIHQFLLREGNSRWIPDATNLFFRWSYQVTVNILLYTM